MTLTLLEISDSAAWDDYVGQHAFGHPLQLWGWGEAKRSTNWSPHRLVLADGDNWLAAVQVLLWPIPRLGRMIAYVPRGPVVDPASPLMGQLLDALTRWAGRHKALYVRVEPAWTKAKLPKGWIHAGHTIQMTETYTIDLTRSEDELLERMSRKHRQYIRKAEREGLIVERASSGPITPMYDVYAQTAVRAGFGIHSAEYYENLYQQFGQHNYLYYASIDGKADAFLWLAEAGPVAYELYGGVTAVGAEAKANYALKWRAIRDLKAAGHKLYDFNGRLNEGVSQFKQGFGPDETNYIGTFDYPLNAFGYQLWERLWPVAKPIGRRLLKRGRK